MSTDLAVIEAALKAATPGPWEAFRQHARVAGPDFIGVLRDIPADYNTDIFATQSCRAEDAELIALLRNSAAELVERVKVAEAAIERVRALHHRRPWGVSDLVTFTQTVFPDQCTPCRTTYPCPTLRALEGDA